MCELKYNSNYTKTNCDQYCMGECSNNHHNNCVGTNQCIKDLEKENEKLKAQLQTLDDETVTVQLTQEDYESLKVKEQECETLKSENFAFEGLVKTLDNLIDYLKNKLQAKEHELTMAKTDLCRSLCKYKINYKDKEQELENLKETIDDFIDDNNSLYLYDGKRPSNLNELQECMQSSINEFYKYKQALESIEKLAKENDIYKSDFGNCGYKNITSNILDIIKSAKDGE